MSKLNPVVNEFGPMGENGPWQQPKLICDPDQKCDLCQHHDGEIIALLGRVDIEGQWVYICEDCTKVVLSMFAAVRGEKAGE